MHPAHRVDLLDQAGVGDEVVRHVGLVGQTAAVGFTGSVASEYAYGHALQLQLAGGLEPVVPGNDDVTPRPGGVPYGPQRLEPLRVEVADYLPDFLRIVVNAAGRVPGLKPLGAGLDGRYRRVDGFRYQGHS